MQTYLLIRSSSERRKKLEETFSFKIDHVSLSAFILKVNYSKKRTKTKIITVETLGFRWIGNRRVFSVPRTVHRANGAILSARQFFRQIQFDGRRTFDSAIRSEDD